MLSLERFCRADHVPDWQPRINLKEHIDIVFGVNDSKTISSEKELISVSAVGVL